MQFSGIKKTIYKMASSIQRPQESRKQQRPESPKLFQNDEILFSPDQIEVPPALPVILKDLSKVNQKLEL